MGFRRIDTPIEGLCVIEPRLFPDGRGWFLETYNRQAFAELGIGVDFVQDNMSRSRLWTLRGLHFQTRRPQAKLVSVLRGRVFDVAVDLREGSPTLGRWHAETLDAESKRMVFVPAGFAHGFLTLEDGTEFCYKCSDYYDPAGQGGIRYDDPDIAIDWPLPAGVEPLLSDKDLRLPRLRDPGGDR
jgi:dTDP-4-dehydrorhamnose 3,5-epimerase